MDCKIILAAAINNIIKLEQDYIEKLIEVPPQKEFGDFSFPCFKLINKIEKNPALIAKEIKSQFENDAFEKVEIQGVYLNFYLNKSKLMNSTVDDILLDEDEYGKSSDGINKKICIESLPSIEIKENNENNISMEVIKGYLTNIFKIQGYDVCSMNHDEDDLYNERITEIKNEIIENNEVKDVNCAKVIELKKYNMSPFIIEEISEEISLEFKMLLDIIYKKEICNFDKYIIVGRKDEKIYFNKLVKVLDIVGANFPKDSLEYTTDFKAIRLDDESYIYVQDAYIKAMNILRKVKKSDLDCKIPNSIDIYSYELVKLLGSFNKEILSAINFLEPSIITRYIIDIVQAFDKFYDADLPIEWDKKQDEIYKIKIIKATTIVLKNAMKLIGVQIFKEI